MVAWYLDRVSHNICCLDKDEGDGYDRCMSLYEKTDYETRHEHARCELFEPDSETEPTGLSLALLRVCRQIHNETALLPYLMNTFAFKGPDDFDIFVGNLLAAQRRAIRRIIIYGVLEHEHHWLDSLSKLSGLTTVKIIRRVLCGYTESLFSEKMMQKLENLQLPNVSIGVWVYHRWVQRGKLIPWEARARAVEQKLRTAGKKTVQPGSSQNAS